MLPPVKSVQFSYQLPSAATSEVTREFHAFVWSYIPIYPVHCRDNRCASSATTAYTETSISKDDDASTPTQMLDDYGCMVISNAQMVVRPLLKEALLTRSCLMHIAVPTPVALCGGICCKKSNKPHAPAERLTAVALTSTSSKFVAAGILTIKQITGKLNSPRQDIF